MANLTRRPEQPFMSLRDAMNQLFAEAFTPFPSQGTSVQALEVLNPDLDPAALQVGQKIRVK